MQNDFTFFHLSFRFISRALCACLLTLSTGSFAEQKINLGPWVVHYMAVNATNLSAQALTHHGIKRDGNTVVLNIAPQHKTGEAFPAKITGTARDLLGSEHRLTFQEVREGKAIYYLASMRHRNQERFKFTIHIEAAGLKKEFEFEQTLYVELG